MTINEQITTKNNINAYSTNEDNGIALYASTSVSNPYTFNITTNKSFFAICEVEWSGGGK